MSSEDGYKIGQKAPDFVLVDQNNQPVKLSDFQGKRNVVLFFYPKDNSPGCTKEACSFRDKITAFNQLDAEVIGISKDTVSSHKRFAEDQGLTFRLLSDEGGKVRKMYGATSFLGMDGRVTFVIDKQGIIADVYDSQIWFNEHVKRANMALQRLLDRSGCTS